MILLLRFRFAYSIFCSTRALVTEATLPKAVGANPEENTLAILLEAAIEQNETKSSDFFFCPCLGCVAAAVAAAARGG